MIASIWLFSVKIGDFWCVSFRLFSPRMIRRLGLLLRSLLLRSIVVISYFVLLLSLPVSRPCLLVGLFCTLYWGCFLYSVYLAALPSFRRYCSPFHLMTIVVLFSRSVHIRFPASCFYLVKINETNVPTDTTRETTAAEGFWFLTEEIH